MYWIAAVDQASLEETISIHRLVQTVVSDGMSDTELMSTLNAVIDLCDQSFPEEVMDETRSLCRRYQIQVVEPLLRMTTIRRARKSAVIKIRVGDFLSYDGKYNDSETFAASTQGPYPRLGDRAS
jgi:hypothetical protein